MTKAHRYALGVVCSGCDAKRGERCATRDGVPCYPHTDRMRRALMRAVRSVQRLAAQKGFAP